MSLAKAIRRHVVRVQRPVRLRELAETLNQPMPVIGGRVGDMVRYGMMQKTDQGYIVIRESESGKRNDLDSQR